MAERLCADRRDAGRISAARLRHYHAQPGVVVLGLARGGVPVASEVATALGAPLDVFLSGSTGSRLAGLEPEPAVPRQWIHALWYGYRHC